MLSKRIIFKIILIFACIFALLPYAIIIICCFSTSASIKGNTIFQNLSFANLIHNFSMLGKQSTFVTSLLNSLFVSLVSSILGVMISAMISYAIVAFNSKFAKNISRLSYLAMFIPEATLLVPLFLLYKFLNLLDSYTAIILSSMSLPFLIFLARQNAESFPKDIIKAARIDGACELYIFLKVFVPTLRDVFVAGFLISFVNAWNSVLIPVVIIQSQNKITNSIFLNSLGSIWFSDYAMLMLALVISTLPVLVLYIIFNRQFHKTIFK